MAKSIDVSDLNIYYGDFLAVEGVNMTVKSQVGHRVHRPVRLRQVDHAAVAEPHARGDPRRARRGQGRSSTASRSTTPSVDPVAVRRQIGMVFQRPNPFPTMSIYDNVLAGNRLNAKRMKKSEADDDRRALAEAAPTSGTRSRTGSTSPAWASPAASSSGCASPARSRSSREVLLMDEPCSALDPISTSAIEDLIHELKSEYTIVIVTHNMQQAARVSDDTGFFNLKAAGQPGHLVEFNPTKKMFSTPDEPVHRGLHLRPLRLSARRSDVAGRPSAVDAPLASSLGADLASPDGSASTAHVARGRSAAAARPAAGKVSTQAVTIERAMPQRTAEKRRVAPEPMIAEVMMWVVEIGACEDERRGVEHRGADRLGGEAAGAGRGG